MNKYEKINYEELEELAIVGGTDNPGTTRFWGTLLITISKAVCTLIVSKIFKKSSCNPTPEPTEPSEPEPAEPADGFIHF